MRLLFDDLTFDVDTRQLWIGGTEARLSPKAFDLLSLLIARRPSALSKAEIREHLWPGTHVSDSSLPSLVSEIRDAIADHERRPTFIRTLHGFGYAFQGQEAGVATNRPHGWLVSATAEIELTSGENVLGREGPGVVLVKSSTVSRRHARISLDAEGALIEDLGSKNGTYVNDRPVSGPTPVVDGDQIRVGSLLFTFKLSRDGESTATHSSLRGRGSQT